MYGFDLSIILALMVVFGGRWWSKLFAATNYSMSQNYLVFIFLPNHKVIYLVHYKFIVFISISVYTTVDKCRIL